MCACADTASYNIALPPQQSISVELWDVSGDRQYEGAWPAIKHGGLGVVYVYDATKVGEEKDLDQWYARLHANAFVRVSLRVQGGERWGCTTDWAGRGKAHAVL